MQVWQAIILGAVQGFAEFLPISSSGHLILLQNWFGIEENVLFYSVMLHVGTLIPVVVVLWKQILDLFKKPFSKFGYLVLATIPAGIIGIVLSVLVDLDGFFAEHLWLLGIAFLLTAGEMCFSEYYSKKKAMINPINTKTAFIMGCGQAVGVIPGISRSGTTITAGTLAKVEKGQNADFTFIMSIPIILAAVVLEGYDCIKAGTLGNINVWALLTGVLTSAVCGYVAIKFMLKLIKKANYKWFSLYLVFLAAATIITSVI